MLVGNTVLVTAAITVGSSYSSSSIDVRRSGNGATLVRASNAFSDGMGSSPALGSQCGSGASGSTNTSENDQGLASSRKRSFPMTSPALGKPVAT